MEERYEIRGKIGQGGIGAVYRGYDTRMNREVAIKRISTAPGDPSLQEESTRQLIKEAGALASLQHPHIVTVYDVGTDEDGPYVVMELISGKTLDELIEHAPLTWPDFRELAMQTQEALIAAQELDLIHSDLKPSNLMLTWLPSGKFQVKIVDFGLATLTQSQSKEELETLEAVFGSIFFMAPEQFERQPLDARSDLYSMGCVYYQALTGIYPFSGETAAEVMGAHLHHTVKPLQELRSDIPIWACDWIMWQINRLPEHRPESARESLSVFLQNDKNPDPTMSLGTAAAANAVKRPRLIIPGSEPPSPATGRVAMAPPATAPVSVAQDAAPQVAQNPTTPITGPITPAMAGSMPPDPVDVPDPVVTKTAPQPLLPPEGSKPSVHTASQSLPEPEPEYVPVVAATRSVHVPPVVSMVPNGGKRKLSGAAKTMIAAVLGLLVVLLGWTLLNRSGKNRKAALYNEMITEAAKGDATEVSVTKIKLDILLESVVSTGVVEQRQTIYKALFLAKAADATDVDARIAEFATTREMLPDVREALIRDVLRLRKNPAVVPTLMTFARSTKDTRAAVAALQAVRYMAGDEQFDAFLEVILSSREPEVRKAAEGTLSEIIKKSKNRSDNAARLATAYESSVDDETRHALLRLLGRCGGEKALELVKKALEGTERNDKIAALTALGSWGDDSAFSLLIEFLAGATDPDLRKEAFDSAIRFLSDATVVRDASATQEHWTQVAAQAKIRAEQDKVIRGVMKFDDEWAIALVEGYVESEDDKIAELAAGALERMRERRRLKGLDE